MSLVHFILICLLAFDVHVNNSSKLFTSLCNFPGMSREDEVFHSGISSAVRWRSVPRKSKIVDGCCRMPMIDIAISFKALNDFYT